MLNLQLQVEKVYKTILKDLMKYKVHFIFVSVSETLCYNIPKSQESEAFKYIGPS